MAPGPTQVSIVAASTSCLGRQTQSNQQPQPGGFPKSGCHRFTWLKEAKTGNREFMTVNRNGKGVYELANLPSLTSQEVLFFPALLSLSLSFNFSSTNFIFIFDHHNKQQPTSSQFLIDTFIPPYRF